MLSLVHHGRVVWVGQLWWVPSFKQQLWNLASFHCVVLPSWNSLTPAIQMREYVEMATGLNTLGLGVTVIISVHSIGHSSWSLDPFQDSLGDIFLLWASTRHSKVVIAKGYCPLVPFWTWTVHVTLPLTHPISRRQPKIPSNHHCHVNTHDIRWWGISKYGNLHIKKISSTPHFPIIMTSI